MKGRQVLLDHIGDIEAAALLVDGRLEDLLLDMPDDLPRPGAIFRAICDRPMKGQGGMMVRLPDGTGFLRQGKGLAPGQPVLVQATGFADPGKAVPVTQKLLFKSRYAIVTPSAPGWNVSRQIRDEQERVRLKTLAEAEADPEFGLILRSAAAGAEDGAVAEDIAAMTDLARAVAGDAAGAEPEALADGDGPHGLAWRDWTEPASVSTESGCFAAQGVLDAINALFDPVEPLGAGSLSVEPTRALVAVDVDTGGDASPAAGLKSNLAAAKALPRALRLQGLGGQVVVDMAPMPKGQRGQVETTLRAALRSDPVETAVVGWTTLGHLELQRKRERLPLRQALPGGLP